jgi:hypothetical protein
MLAGNYKAGEDGVDVQSNATLAKCHPSFWFRLKSFGILVETDARVQPRDIDSSFVMGYRNFESIQNMFVCMSDGLFSVTLN